MNIAIILAGGRGSRMGCDIPKQYLEVNGKPVIGYCLEVFLDDDSIDAVQIVADVFWRGYIKQYMEDRGLAGKWRGFSEPGANRQLSIFHALEDVFVYAHASDYVVIHDAVRPMVGRDLIKTCLERAKGHDGVLPVLPMKDTVYLSEDGEKVSSLLPRERIFAGQAPEVFLLGKYYEANRALLPDRILAVNGSSEPAVIAGMDIVMTDGDEENIKITTKEDMTRFRQKLDRGKEDGDESICVTRD